VNDGTKHQPTIISSVISIDFMWVKQCHKPSRKIHHVLLGGMNLPFPVMESWVVKMALFYLHDLHILPVKSPIFFNDQKPPRHCQAGASFLRDVAIGAEDQALAPHRGIHRCFFSRENPLEKTGDFRFHRCKNDVNQEISHVISMGSFGFQ